MSVPLPDEEMPK
jgi:hypothetical protein